MQLYNPVKAPHILETVSTLKDLKLYTSTYEDTLASNVNDKDGKPRAMTASAAVRPTKGFDVHGELRKIWQIVLKECHRFDPERSGFVYRNAFFNAIEKASLSKVSD